MKITPLLLTLAGLCGGGFTTSRAIAADPPDSAAIKAYDIDFNWGPGGPNAFAKPGLWAEADPREHVAWYKALGCNTIQTFCVSCNGYAWYKGGTVPEQPGLLHDFLPEMVQLAHQQNMRVFGYFCIGSNTRWGRTRPALSYGFPAEPHIPYTDEYLAYLDAAIRDAVSKTGIDGFMVDWLRMPTSRASNGGKWLDCEKQLYARLLGEPFPGEDALTAAQMTDYGRKAVDRCWATIRKAAKETNPNCLVWLTCCDINDPHIANSRALRETDWLLNEAGDIKRTEAAKSMIGPQTRLITCLAQWNGQNPDTVIPAAKKSNIGLYGFTKPTLGNLKPPVASYLAKPPQAFQGDERNIATLARTYLGLPPDAVLTPPDTGLQPSMPPTPCGPTPDEHQLQWARETDLYGMVNFSTITYFGKEWGYGDEDAAKFNPTGFDALQIVRAAKAGGLKGLVIDAKHHGGFCLWPSKVNDNYSVKNCPWKNGQGDIVRELVDACRAEGLKVGIYLSPWDRNHKDYGTPAYLDYYEAQLTELLTGYGPVFEVWLDGANGGDGYYGGARTVRKVDQKNYYPIKKWFALIRKLQPAAMIFSDMGPDVRWNGNEHGISGERSNGTCWASIHQPNWAEANPAHLNRGDRDGEAYIPAEGDFPLLDKAWFWNPRTRTRTPAELVNLYFTTIGRNSAMDIGIAPDTRGLMGDKDMAALAGFGERIKAIFATNLAATAKVSASNVRGNNPNYAASQVVTGWSNGKFWATDDAVRTPDLVVDFGKPTEFSVISLREHIALGECVDDWALDSWQNGMWLEFAKGTGIGMRRLWRGLPITSNKIRLRITKAESRPALAEFAVYLEPENSRKECGVKAPPLTGLPKDAWKIVAATSEGAPAAKATDNDPNTFWHSHTAAGPQPCPQEIVVDMAASHEITGMLYTPRQDHCTVGNIANYAFYLSEDGKTWSEPAAQGEFANIKSSPEQQVVMLATPAAGRFFKFVALRSADGIPVAAAEIGVLGK